jgi:nucleoid-associated protein YgaU
MASIPFSKLEKMTILPYGNKEEKDGKIVLKDPAKKGYEVMYNPTSMSVQHGLNVTIKPAIGEPKSDTQVMNGQNSTMSVELFFDGTGVSPSPSGSLFAVADIAGAFKGDIVSKSIRKFYETVLQFNADTHLPRFLHISWGNSFLFACQLQSATTNYLLFDKSGEPLRATVSASFVQVRDDAILSELGSKLGFMSPDVTKTHVVKAGDTIYNLAKKEYDDESYYLQIAEVNNLKNYRRLIPGQKLILPSVNKS